MKPIAFTKLEVVFEEVEIRMGNKVRKENLHRVDGFGGREVLESATLIREVELRVGCDELKQVREKRDKYLKNRENTYKGAVKQCTRMVEHYKLKMNEGEIKEVSREEYRAFLSEHLNIEAGMKSFVVMQNDLNPQDFNSKKHSAILERISGASKYTELFEAESKVFAREVKRYEAIKSQTKHIEG